MADEITQPEQAPESAPQAADAPSPVVGSDSQVAPSTTGSGSGAAPDQTSGTPLTGEGPEHQTDAGLIAPPSSAADDEGSQGLEGITPNATRGPVLQHIDEDDEEPQPSAAAAPVTVDHRTRRSGDDALLGSWVDVVSGEFAGRFGSYVDTVHHDPASGYPTVILIRSRDARNELLEVSYEDVRPSERNGGR